jgi:plasmid maintenance system antidote protein VapI
MAKRRKAAEAISLADQLRSAVVGSGLSQYAIAKNTGIAQPVITRFVNGTRSISIETADKLAIYFGMRLTLPHNQKP